MKTFNLKKLHHQTEQKMAFGGVDLLEKPLLVKAIVMVAIATDFSVFYSSLSSLYSFWGAFITASCSAALIDAIPLVTARCISDLQSDKLTEREKRWRTITIVISILAFLLFFLFSALVRFNSGASLFSADLVDQKAAALKLSDLNLAQKSMLMFTCALPLFTSVGVFLVGLFVDSKAKRRKLLRTQRNILVDARTQLIMQSLELESSLEQNLDDQDSRLFENMNGYIAELGCVLQIYYRKALAESLATPDDISHLARRSNQLLALENQLIHLSEATPQMPVAVGDEH